MMPGAQTMAQFYVHIVESPSPDELLNGMTEGQALCSFLSVAGIPFSYNMAVDYERFRNAMTSRVQQAVQIWQLKPILHFSIHGGDDGVQLCSQRDTGSIVTWPKLSEFIRPIHQQYEEIGVCMSACGGANGRKMAEVHRKEDVPFAWLVGTHAKIEVRDAALAFAVYYRCFQRGDIQNILPAMQLVAGTAFVIEFGKLTQLQYANKFLGSQALNPGYGQQVRPGSNPFPPFPGAPKS
jgi:hypothetical protein